MSSALDGPADEAGGEEGGEEDEDGGTEEDCAGEGDSGVVAVGAAADWEEEEELVAALAVDSVDLAAEGSEGRSAADAECTDREKHGRSTASC